MPWVRALLRGQRVYARARPDGSLHVDGGRVAVRYKPQDGREYLARAGNLTIEDATPLADDTCGPATPSPPRQGGAGGRSPPSSKKPKHAEPPPPPSADAVIAYADGACSGNPGPCGLGVVILDGGVRTEISEHLGVGTNNIAELTAVERALDAVPDPARPLVIYTDSSYAIGVLAKGWKAKANVPLIQRLRDKLAPRRATRFVHVRGHAGVPLNEKADELAREAVKSRRTRSERFG